MNNTTKLFIDGSYFVFYRFFATSTWYKLNDNNNNNKDNEETSEKKDELLKQKYTKMFEKTICDLVKKHGVSWNDVYFAKDCPRELIWRNKYIGNYKATRVAVDPSCGDIFKYTYETLLPELVTKYGFNVIQHDGLEADDIIALMTKKTLDENTITSNITKPIITIITNDNDYIQLLTDKNKDYIQIFNLQGIDISTRNKIGSAEEYLHNKIIVGDKSDNIPQIGPKCGPKTALKLINDEQARETYFQKNPGSKEQYEKNRILMDFDYIEKDLANEFLKSFVEKKNMFD